jgi:hypothetical protein
MRPSLLGASIAAIVFANMLVFGAISTYVFPPTPRPPRVVQYKTFTPNPEYAKRLVTATPTPTPPPPPTLRPTEYPLRDPRVPLGQPEE